ncbi:hypothetical protein ACFQZC_30705 [Streptacidiphilus monticola]
MSVLEAVAEAGATRARGGRLRSSPPSAARCRCWSSRRRAGGGSATSASCR